MTIAPTWRLVGAAAAGDGGLDLARGVQGDREAAPGRHQDRDRAGLGGAHHGAHVVLAEHPLDGDGVRRELVEHRLDPPLEGEEPVREIEVRRRTDDADRDEREAPAGAPSTTPRPQRVRPGSTPSTRMRWGVPSPSEQVFGC